MRHAQVERVAVDELGSAELREVERGLRLMLARKFSARWINEHVKDLIAQAGIEYAEWLETNAPARNPVGWLLTCAYRRALNQLDTETRRPQVTSLDDAFQLADESTSTPEQEALDNDRQRRLREALDFLPAKECKLLALVYFEDHSVREAGRKVGWQKSAADRHHHEALKKLRALVGERNVLSPSAVGVAAWIIATSETPGSRWRPVAGIRNAAREGIALLSEVATATAHRLAEVWRRIVPFSEPGNAVAASSAARTAGYCGVAVGAVICGLAATGAVGPGLSVVEADRADQPGYESERAEVPVVPAIPNEVVLPLERDDAAEPKESNRTRRARTQTTTASTRQTVEEFGIEQGGESTTAEGTSPGIGPGSEAPAPKVRSSSGSANSDEFGF